MAKKKKSTKKKKVEQAPKEPSVFWPLAASFILVLLGLFLLLGTFGTGGPLPKGMYHGAYWLLGWAAVLSPFALVYWGVVKFRNEDRKIPFKDVLSMSLVLVFAASWLHVALAKRSLSGTGWVDGHGGAAGNVVGGVVLNALDKFPAGLLFFLATLLAACFAFGASPKVLLKPFGMFKRPPREEGEITDLAELKAKSFS